MGDVGGGFWLEAANYYYENFYLIKHLVNHLDIGQAHSIKITQNLFKSSQLKSNLAFISANFSGFSISNEATRKKKFKT